MSTWTILPLVLTLVVNDPIPAATAVVAFRFEPCPLEPRNESEDRLTAWQAPTPLRIVVFRPTPPRDSGYDCPLDVLTGSA